MQLKNKILLIGLLAFVSSCSILKRKPTVNEPIIDYRPVASNVQPDIFIHRNSNNKSELYLRIPKQLYTASKVVGESLPTVSLSIDLKIIVDPLNAATDSIHFTLTPSVAEMDKSFITRNIDIPAALEMHWVNLTITNNIRNIARMYFIKVPSMDFSSTCFPINSQSKLPVFQQNIKPGEGFSLSCADDLPDSVLVSYYPFSFNFSYLKNADSTWFQKPTKGEFGFFEHEGIYRISVNSSVPGFYLRVFNRNFPVLNTPNDLWKPLTYIANSSEIAYLDTISHRKLAIDEFWLSRGGNPYKSRELLELFYGRVFWANQLFSEAIPGWQTDRGKTMILLGIPIDVISDGKSEKWFYRNPEGKKFAVEFFDNSSKSPFPEFRFIKRIPIDIEKTAVESWNKGEPINFGQTN